MTDADPVPLKWASSVGASCVALAAALMLATSAVAQEAKSFAISESKAFLIPDDVLLDIRPVRVSVTIAIDEGLGITEQFVEDAVELTLRKYRVPYDSGQVSSFIQVTVGATRFRKYNSYYAFLTTMRLMHAVLRYDHPDIEPSYVTIASIWTRSNYGVSSSDKLKDLVEESLIRITNDFSLDYLRANDGHLRDLSVIR